VSSFCLMGTRRWPNHRGGKGMQDKGGNEVKKGQEVCEG